MNTALRFITVLIVLSLALTACRESQRSARPPTVDGRLTTNSPVIAFWDGGDPTRPASVIFAAWTDGMFVRSVGGRLRQGRVSQSEIESLMSEVEAAGFFSRTGSTLLDSYGLAVPDGRVRCLAAARHGTLVQRYYDGHDDFSDVGPHANPSREQMEAFARMWQRVIHATDAVRSGQLSDFHNERDLKYPGAYR